MTTPTLAETDVADTEPLAAARVRQPKVQINYKHRDSIASSLF